MGRINDIDNQIQELSLSFIQERSKEYIGKRLSGRLVLEFHLGNVTQIYDQPVIKGVSQLAYYMDKIEE